MVLGHIYYIFMASLVEVHNQRKKLSDIIYTVVHSDAGSSRGLTVVGLLFESSYNHWTHVTKKTWTKWSVVQHVAFTVIILASRTSILWSMQNVLDFRRRNAWQR